MSKTVEETFNSLQQRFRAAIQNPSENGVDLMQFLVEAMDLLNIDPENPRCLFLFGVILQHMNMHGAAISVFHRALHSEPLFAEALNNLGASYRALYDYDKAEAALKKSVQIKKAPEAFNNLGALYVNTGDPQKGIPYLIKSMELAPPEFRDRHPRWNISLLQIESGDLCIGFKNYEAGLFTGDRLLKSYKLMDGKFLPWWDGSPGKRVLLYDEQGLGDRILFANLIRKVLETNEVIYDCHDRLYTLFGHSFPGIIRMYPSGKQISNPEWCKYEEADAVFATTSLGSIYWNDYSDIDRTPYLSVTPEATRHMRNRLAKLGPPPYVGIGYMGGTGRTHGMERSFKLSQFLPIFRSGATFVSVQYTPEAVGKIGRFNEEHPELRPIGNFPDVVYSHDYWNTASLISALDLVIVPNTSIVHLAGALGTPVWTLTPVAKAWRYCGPDPKHLPWYGEHVRQFRQERKGEWGEVLEQVRVAFNEWLASKGYLSSDGACS